MIVSLGFVDELGGRDLFNESNVGDTDGDGLSEFLDAWGTPIGFLRWSPGFTESELNGAGGMLQSTGGSPSNTIVAYGSPAGLQSYGLARRNNAYAGKTITVCTPATTSTPQIMQAATILSSAYNASNGTTTINVSGAGITANGGETFGIDADPFDPVHVYPMSINPGGNQVPFTAVPFAIYPLIYSAGPNKTFGVITDFSNATPLQYNIPASVGMSPSPLFPNGVNNYPFLTDTLSGDPDQNASLGTTTDLSGEQSAISTWESLGWMDNIHNHMIGTR